MSTIDTYYIDPDSKLDYTVDWARWLPTGDTIDVSLWILDSGITEELTSNTTTTATLWRSGGTEHETYKATNRIVTTGGRIEDKTLTFICKEK